MVWRACVDRVAHPVHLERVGGARDTIESAVRPATIGEAEDFQIAPGATLFALERLRMLDELPVALDFTLVPVALNSSLSGLDWGVASLYAAHGSAGHRPVAADYPVEAHPANDRSARLLGAAVGTPLLAADSRIYAPDGRLIVSGRISYRGDRYRFRSRLTAEQQLAGAAGRRLQLGLGDGSSSVPRGELTLEPGQLTWRYWPRRHGRAGKDVRCLGTRIERMVGPEHCVALQPAPVSSLGRGTSTMNQGKNSCTSGPMATA